MNIQYCLNRSRFSFLGFVVLMLLTACRGDNVTAPSIPLTFVATVSSNSPLDLQQPWVTYGTKPDTAANNPFYYLENGLNSPGLVVSGTDSIQIAFYVTYVGVAGTAKPQTVVALYDWDLSADSPNDVIRLRSGAVAFSDQSQRFLNNRWQDPTFMKKLVAVKNGPTKATYEVAADSVVSHYVYLTLVRSFNCLKEGAVKLVSKSGLKVALGDSGQQSVVKSMGVPEINIVCAAYN